MSDFILEYDVLAAIAKNSTSLGKQARDYSESLESKIISGIESVTGPPSGYLINASDMVRDKINTLKLKSEAFYSFANQISNLLEVAEQMDQEVADAIAAQREYFLDHHESLRIEDWRAKLLDLLVEIKNSIPLLGLIADILDGLKTMFDSLEDAVKHWYECEGGKYILKAIGSVLAAVAAVALFVIAFPASGFFAICGAIGAGIALINAVTNVATSFRAADAGVDGNPAWAVIYGKQDKLSDVLRQTNFGSGMLNGLSNLGAGVLDTTETFCDIMGFAEMGMGIAKLFKGDTFKLLKNGNLKFSDLKNSAKNGIVDLKNTIKNGFADLKNGGKSVEGITESLGRSNGAGSIKGYSNFTDGMSPEDAARYIKSNETKFYVEFSERAQASGLNSTQISEAYNAMKAGDYAKMSSHFDTSSPYNGSVFWSGNQVGAGQYAQSIGGTIMEQTPGGQVFNNWRGLGGMYPEWGTNTVLDQKPIWEALSSQYANGASGNVTYAHPLDYVGNVWEKVELPIIKTKIKKGTVTGIQEVFIDGK